MKSRCIFYIFIMLISPVDFLKDNAQKCINSVLLASDMSDEVIYVVNLNFIFQVPVIYYNTNHNFTRNFYNKPTTFILAGNVCETLENLYNQTLFNSRAKFIILVAKISKKFYKTLDDYNIYKVLVIIKSTMQMFVYQTSKKSNYQMVPLTSTCSALKINVLTTEKTEISTLKTMYALTPPGIINKKEGTYIEIVNIILLNMNVTMDFVKTENYDTLSVPSQFKTGKFDFFIAPISEHMIQSDILLDKTITVNLDVPVFVVPRVTKPKNIWHIFYEEFSMVVWLCFFTVAFVLYWLFMYFYKRVEMNQNVDMYIAMISILFEGCTNLHIKSVGLRLLLVNYLIFCLILTTVYKTRMFDIMIKDIPSELFEKSQDIWKYSNFRMCFPNAALFYIFNTSGYPPYRELTKNNRAFVDEAHNCLEKVAKDKNKLTYLLLSSIEYYVPDFYLDEGGKSLVHTFDIDQLPVSLCFCFREGHPIFPAFNSKLARLKESGIINHIFLKASSTYRKAKALANAKDLFQYNALNVDHLGSTFLVYLFGILFSMIAFCLEYFHVIKK
ncbi:Ionotropic receptor 151 [Diabrotica virgifera virgifera]|nr:Ionotropic receptor 151 [Diabrotica virgifera virgifera]